MADIFDALHSDPNDFESSGLERTQAIVEALKSHQITSPQAKELLANKKTPLTKYIQLVKNPVFIPNQAKNDLPYMISLWQYATFSGPVTFARKTTKTGKNPDGRVVLPVTPEQIDVALGNNASTFSTITGNTHSHAGSVDLEKISFESFFPYVTQGQEVPSYVAPYLKTFGIIIPNALATMFRRLIRVNQPFNLLITKVNSEGSKESNVYGPIVVTCTSFSTSIKHGHDFDLFYSVEFQRWHPQSSSITGTSGNNALGSGSNKGKKYTTKPGDNLFKISQKFLGTGSLWNSIYQLNKSVLNPSATAPIKAKTTIKLP